MMSSTVTVKRQIVITSKIRKKYGIKNGTTVHKESFIEKYYN